MKTELDIVKEELIKVLKNPRDVDICNYCKFKITCKSKQCPKFCSGIGDVDGKFPNFKWTCEDFNFGTCDILQNSPCNACIENNYKGFILDLNKLSSGDQHEHIITYEEDDCLPRNDEFVNVDIFMKCKCQVSIDELNAIVYNKFGFLIMPYASYGITESKDCIIYSVKIHRSTWI